MSRRLLRRLIYAAIALAYVLHNDLWLRHEPRPWLGLPASLTYHVVYCVAVAGLMALVVRFAWPVEERGDGAARKPSE